MAKPKYSPLGERIHVRRLIQKYEWMSLDPGASAADIAFLARLRGRLGELDIPNSDSSASETPANRPFRGSAISNLNGSPLGKGAARG